MINACARRNNRRKFFFCLLLIVTIESLRVLGVSLMEYHLVAPVRVTRSCAARGSASGVTILVGGVDRVESAVALVVPVVPTGVCSGVRNMMITESVCVV